MKCPKCQLDAAPAGVVRVVAMAAANLASESLGPAEPVTGLASTVDDQRRRRRRACLTQLAAFMAIGSPALIAQPRPARVGWLDLFPPKAPGIRNAPQSQFLNALQERGWREPGNLVFEVRAPTSDKSLSEAASDLVSLKPDVLISAGTPAVKLLRELTAEIPIVMAGAGDPVGTGLVASLSRPGGNVTGVSWQLHELIPKTLSLMHEMVPRAGQVDLINQAHDPGHAFFASVMADAAASRHLGSRALQVRDVDELATAIDSSVADAAVLLATPMIYARAERIAAVAIARRLPLALTGGPGRGPIAAGLLFCYCANAEDTLRRAADCVDRILRGAKPSEMPVEQPLRHDFIINLKTAYAIGLSVPNSLLFRADELIK